MIYIALLRASNIGGHQTVSMQDLRSLLSELGFQNARSLLQSGNLVFGAGRQSTPAVERTLETKAAQRLGFHTDFVVRTAAEWQSIIARNPFLTEAERDPSRLVVMFLKSAACAAAFAALRAAITGPESLHGDGRHAYIFYPEGIGRSRLTSMFIERKLGTRGTARNWNTVTKLAELAGS
jgi:uncharacterized protein (DUF1697 family)